MSCTSCSKELPAGAKFCKFCGAEQVTSFEDPVEKVPDGARFEEELNKDKKANIGLLVFGFILFACLATGTVWLLYKDDNKIPLVAGPLQLPAGYIYKCKDVDGRSEEATLSVDPKAPKIMNSYAVVPGTKPIKAKWSFVDNKGADTFSFRYKLDENMWMILEPSISASSLAFFNDGKWNFLRYSCAITKK